MEQMKINQELSNEKLDVWECDCGTHTPVRKGSPKPDCEYCRRVKTVQQIPAFIIDDSALKNIFEGKNKGSANKLLMKLKEMNDSGMKVTAITTLSAFLRAIFLSDPEVKIGKIQKTLSFLQVSPSFADFKNRKEVINEFIQFAHVMSRGKKHAR